MLAPLLVALSFLASAPSFGAEESKPVLSGSVSNETSLTRSDTTAGNPRAGSFGDRLSASFTFFDAWTIDLGFSFSAIEGTTPATGASFGDSGGKSVGLSGGLGWQATPQLSLGVSFDLSPRSTTQSTTSLAFDIPGSSNTVSTVTTDAELRSQSGGGELGLSATWETNGDTALEWRFGVEVDSQRITSEQQVLQVRRRDTGALVTSSDLKAFCSGKGSGSRCAAALQTALSGQSYSLDVGKLSLTAGATLFDDTDLALTLDGWAYAQDPAQVGYFSLTSGAHGVSGGGGVPIAPMRSSLGAQLTHRFGDLSVRLQGSAGRYVEQTGGSTFSGGARVQYRFTRWLRAWITLSARHDVDAVGSGSVSRSGAGGIGVRF
jgi:hypothetical protein